MRCITMVGVLARQSQKCNSEYLPQRRQGRKDRKIIINNFFKIILSFLRNLACFAPWRESSLLIASFMSDSKCLHLRGTTLARQARDGLDSSIGIPASFLITGKSPKRLGVFFLGFADYFWRQDRRRRLHVPRKIE